MVNKLTDILVVDDNEQVLNVIEDYLVLFGFHVQTCKNGAEAYEKLRTDHFDVMITDIDMPVMTGLELIEKARELNIEEMTILVMSGSGLHDLSRVKGVTRMFQKPLVLAQLIDEIFEIMRNGHKHIA